MKAQPGARIEPRDPEPRTGDSQVMERIAGASPRHLARIAGGLYLIIIVGGFFAIGFVPAALVVPGDAAATAHNILAHELLYRSGIAAHLFPYIQVPSGVAELSLCLWLLVMGVNVSRWEKQASKASEPDQSDPGRAAV
jgi:hypothetical protein